MRLLIGCIMGLCVALLVINAADARDIREHLSRSTEWVAERLGEDDLVLVHVAETTDQFNDAHVPGAQFLPWSAIVTKRSGVIGMMPPAEELAATFEALGVSEDKSVVFYDEEGGFRAAWAYVALDYLGAAESAALMDGHWPMWEREERPVQHESESPASGTLTVSLNPIIVDLHFVRDVVWAKSVGMEDALLIDARPPEQYSGEEPGDAIERGGHIPGAVNIYWEEAIVALDAPLLRSPDALHNVFGEIADERIIVYCRTSAQSAHTYFILRYLGYDPVIFDGSFMQWQADPDTQVAQR